MIFKIPKDTTVKITLKVKIQLGMIAIQLVVCAYAFKAGDGSIPWNSKKFYLKGFGHLTLNNGLL